MHILIADDESIIRMGLKSMLQHMGHEVLTAVNGRLFFTGEDPISGGEVWVVEFDTLFNKLYLPTIIK